MHKLCQQLCSIEQSLNMHVVVLPSHSNHLHSSPPKAFVAADKPVPCECIQLTDETRPVQTPRLSAFDVPVLWAVIKTRDEKGKMLLQTQHERD